MSKKRYLRSSEHPRFSQEDWELLNCLSGTDETDQLLDTRKSLESMKCQCPEECAFCDLDWMFEILERYREAVNWYHDLAQKALDLAANDSLSDSDVRAKTISLLDRDGPSEKKLASDSQTV